MSTRMNDSDLDCSSYQSGDPRKYEIGRDSPTSDEKREADRDWTLDILMEVNSPGKSDNFFEIITELRKEKKDLQRQVRDKNGELFEAHLTEERLHKRIEKLEVENLFLKEELAKKSD